MRFAKIARIQDFMPDSVDWDAYITRGYAERVRDDIADAENEAMRDIAKMHAKEIKKAGIRDEQQMAAQANRDLIGTGIRTAGQIGLAGYDAGWFSGGGGGTGVSLDGYEYGDYGNIVGESDIGDAVYGYDPNFDPLAGL